MTKGALAQSQLDAGQIQAARLTIVDAIKDRDDIPELHLLRGRIELALGSPATAFSAFNSALSLDSSNGPALLGVAQIGMQLGYLRESESAADKILTLDPRQPNALLIKGLHNFNRRRYAEALANADAILQIVPNDEGGTILKTRTLSLLGRKDEAVALAEDARKRLGNTRGIAVTLLELYRQQGDGPAMIGQLEQLRKMEPDNRALDIDQADTLYKLGETARARAILFTLTRTGGIDDHTAEAVTRLWQEYDPEPLDAQTLSAISAQASLPARKVIARYYLGRNDPARASAALRNAPAEDDILALRAQIGIVEGKLDESYAQAQAILEKDQTHCDALLAKAQVDLAKGRAQEAANAGQSAVGNCPQLVAGYVALARARELAGSKEGTDIAFRDGFARNNQDPQLARMYAVWLERHGEGRRALGVARRLTKNTPALLSAWKLYQELCGRIAEAYCSADADAGFTFAQQRYGVDPRTGERQNPGLFGRLNKQ